MHLKLLVLCQAASAVKHFLIFLGLNFPQLLDVLRNGLKFHNDIKRGLKNPLNFKKTISCKKTSELVFRFIFLLSHHRIHLSVPGMQVYCLGRGYCIWQKQSFAYVLQNRYSLKSRKFHKKKPVLGSLFNKDLIKLY